MRPDGKSWVYLPSDQNRMAAGASITVSGRRREGFRAEEGDLKIYAAGASLDDEEAIMWLCACPKFKERATRYPEGFCCHTAVAIWCCIEDGSNVIDLR